MTDENLVGKFDGLVDAAVQEYVQHVETNRYSEYMHLFFGGHAPSDVVKSIAHNLKKAFMECEAAGVFSYAEAIANGPLYQKSRQPERVFTIELYSRIASKAGALGKLYLPLMLLLIDN